MTRQERLQEWVNTLSDEQIKEALITTVSELIEVETVRFWDDSDEPYWDSCGESLVE